MSSLAELKADIAELRKFHEQASRQKVKDILFIDIRKLETELTRLHEAEESAKKDNANESSANQPTKPATAAAPVYTEEIRTYGWDQSDKFMKVYVTLNGVQHIDAGNVACNFHPRGFKLCVDNLTNKNYILHVGRLSEEILPSKSYYKVKTDMVLVMLKKKEEGKTWPYITQKEEKKKKTEKPAASAEPQDGLMNLLKDMYEDGDDEMKRTIAQAWSKSREKNPADGSDLP